MTAQGEFAALELEARRRGMNYGKFVAATYQWERDEIIRKAAGEEGRKKRMRREAGERSSPADTRATALSGGGGSTGTGGPSQSAARTAEGELPQGGKTRAAASGPRPTARKGGSWPECRGPSGGPPEGEPRRGSEEIRTLRKRMGLSQAAFAEVAGVSQALVCRWENGRPPEGWREIVARIQRRGSGVLKR